MIIGLYNSPLANMKILKEAVIFMAQYPEAYVICMGDFNILMNPVMDKHGKLPRDQVGGKSKFGKFVEEVGGVDIWRIKNPQTKGLSMLDTREGKYVQD